MKKLVVFLLMMSMVAIASDEINITATLKLKNGDIDTTRTVQNLKRDQTGNAFTYNIISITTSTNYLQIVSDVEVGGYAWMRNVSTNGNDINVNGMVLLKDSDVALFRVSTTNIPAWTTNGTSNLEYWIIEE